MSVNRILDLANPVSDCRAFDTIGRRWKENPQCKLQLVCLIAFAALASILGVGIATPLIFRTIILYGIGAIEDSASTKDRNPERFFIELKSFIVD